MLMRSLMVKVKHGSYMQYNIMLLKMYCIVLKCIVILKTPLVFKAFQRNFWGDLLLLSSSLLNNNNTFIFLIKCVHFKITFKRNRINHFWKMGILRVFHFLNQRDQHWSSCVQCRVLRKVGHCWIGSVSVVRQPVSHLVIL